MLISASEIITKSIDLYVKNWKLFLKYALLYFLLSLVPIILKVSVMPSTETEFLEAGLFSLEIISYFLISILGFVVVLWSSAAFMQAIARRYKDKEHHSLLNQFEESSKILFPLVVVSVLTKILIGLSTLALILPGIMVSIWLFFASHEVVLSKKSIWSSITGSRDLVVHRWWRVFWRIIAPQLYFVVFWVIAQMILQFLLTLIVGGGIITSLLVSISVVVFLPLMISATVILYLELKRNPVEEPQPHPDPDKIN